MASERPIHPIAVGDVLNERYRLENLLGEGGMGCVYAAHDLELDRPVAVKVLSPRWVHDDEVVARFEKEARLTAKLEHPNIVAVFDVGQTQGRPWFVMQRLSGQTLAAVLKRQGALPPREVVALFTQLAAGIDFLHQKGFIHRDIKAENIFIGGSGHATLLDFGIVKHSDAAATRSGLYVGTPHYLSPEEALGTPVDHRADLYALGVVLYECLCGMLPFEGESEVRLVHLHAHSPAPEILKRAPWLSKATAAVVRKALAKKADDRFASAQALVQALTASFENDGTPQGSFGARAAPSAPSAPTQLSERKTVRRSLSRQVMAAALLLPLVGAAVVVFQNRPAQVSLPPPAPLAALPPLPSLPTTELPAPAPEEAPAPTAPEKLAPARLTVVTLRGGEPFWADVSVDGVARGRTPLSLELAPGLHTLRVERAGFSGKDVRLNLASGNNAAQRLELEPLP